MALTFVKKAALPVLGKGKEGKDSLNVADNGQVTFSATAYKTLGQPAKIAIAVDGSKLAIYPSTHADVVKSKVPEESMFILRKATKGGTASFAGSSLFQFGMGAYKYDYKNSGSQSFDITMNKGVAVVMLPESGSLPKRPVQPRKPRAKKQQVNGVVANPGEVTGAPLVVDEGTELQLEV